MTRRSSILLLLAAGLLVASWLLFAGGASVRHQGDGEAGGIGVVEAFLTDDGPAATEVEALAADGGVVERRELGRDEDPRPRLPAATVLVLDQNGRPLRGATVRASAAGAFDEQVTGADGRVTVSLPDAPSVELRAVAPRHLPAGLADWAFGTAATIQLPAAALLMARVQDGDGAPLAGVRVRTRGRTGARGDTDAAGLVVLDGLRPSTYDLTFEGRTGKASRFFMVAGVYLAPGDNQVDVALPPGQTVRGIARSKPSGDPLANARITLSWEARAGNLSGFHQRLETRTDAEGGFVFPGVAPGSIRVRADAAGHTPVMRPFELRESRGEQRVELDLVAAAIVRGRIVDVDQSAVVGAEVSFGWWGGDTLRFGPTAESDGEGRFELRDVPVRANAFVAAMKTGRAANGVGVDALQPGDVREGIVVELKRGVRVRGRVRSEDGTSVSGGQVRIAPRHGADRYAIATTTDVNGIFVFDEVVAFPSHVSVVASGHVPFGQDINLRDDRPETDLRELTVRVAHTLDGIVVGRGQLVGFAAVRVSVTAREKNGTRSATGTDDLGRFSIADLPRGEYLLDVRGPDVLTGKPVPVAIPHRGPLRVFVDPMVPLGTGILEVRVVDGADGQPKPDALIAGIDRRRVAFVDGSYSLRGIDAGRVDLQFGAKGYQSVAVSGALVMAGQVRRLGDVVLMPGTSLRVRVLDERGRPFKPAQVEIQLVDDQQLTFPGALAPATGEASKGIYTWEGLALSRFTLRVRGPATHLAHEQAVEIFTTQAAGVQVRLARAPKKAPPKDAGTPPPQRRGG